jgi:hypothetical protein
MLGDSHSHHLSDDQLVESYLLAAEDRHLEVCLHCQARFEALVSALEQIREGGVQEADTIFTPERLREQRDRILRHLEGPAEIVRFPAPSAHHRAVRRVFGPARRWVAGAAAAGLAAGLFLGMAMDGRSLLTHARGPVEAASASEPELGQLAADPADEQILSEIEDDLLGRRVIELRALDAMTIPPELREASLDLH